jgi:1-aminocyclopropane-1-carboxylate deaminase
LNLSAVTTHTISSGWLAEKEISLDVLRLDKIHPIVSGNKYFKLKFYLEDAVTLGKTTIATFGGAWSNHIIATAFAAQEKGLKSIGFIRGEQPKALSDTLKDAMRFGMELIFVSREQYRFKDEIINNYSGNDVYWINEGGYGTMGAKGAGEIINLARYKDYTHIIAAVGTGTMLAGLISSVSKEQQVIGISSMKGNSSLEQEIRHISPKNATNFTLFHDYHFGGYGKHPQQLIDYINLVYENNRLPLDIVYTGKTFYAIEDLVKKDYFPAESKLLMIHSGGLQGNKSLPPEVLAF